MNINNFIIACESNIISKKEWYANESKKYDPPMSLQDIKKYYGIKFYNKLKKDKVHRYRAENGIELIHKEPTKEELERIMKNWNYMTDEQKELSDKQSIKLFGMDNKTHYDKLIKEYVSESCTSESIFIANETKSTIDKNFRAKGKLSLSSFKKIRINERIIEKYKKEYPLLKHVRCKDTNEYICDGYMWLDGDKLVCVVGSCEYLDNHEKYIVSLEVMNNYKGYGLS